RWRSMRLALAVLLVALGGPAGACQFDTDCSPGSRCIRSPGSLYGACFGGLAPGNRNDRAPAYDPRDLNRTAGDTCRFGVDCGPGGRCLKAGGIYGVCD